MTHRVQLTSTNSGWWFNFCEEIKIGSMNSHEFKDSLKPYNARYIYSNQLVVIHLLNLRTKGTIVCLY